MGNFTSCMTTSDEEPSASVPTALPPKVLIDNIYQEWVKIQNHIEQSCLGREEITKNQLAIWNKFRKPSKKLFMKYGVYFPFNKVDKGILKRYTFMLFRLTLRFPGIANMSAGKKYFLASSNLGFASAPGLPSGSSSASLMASQG